MNIIETSIPDIDLKNLDEEKLILSEKIIEGVYPLIDDIIQDRKTNLSELEERYKHLRKRIYKEKEELELLMVEHRRKKKLKTLVDRISKLVSAGLVHEGSTRNQMVVLLKIIDKLPEEKLDYQLREVTNIISKRFART